MLLEFIQKPNDLIIDNTFSIEDGYPFIYEVTDEELIQYMGGICKNSDFQPVKIWSQKKHKIENAERYLWD
jgi:hypothetical protein